MSEIVVLIPVYQRPHRVQPLVSSFQESQPGSARLLFIASPEDEAERAALAGVAHLVLPERRSAGDWARKINYGYRITSEPWILCGADDIAFHPGWDKALLRTAAETGKRVIGTHDLNPSANPRGIYSPHPLVARSYADEEGTIDGPGAIFCEEYDHNWPDRELAGTAIARGEWAFARDAVLEHLHHAFSDVEFDATYELGMSKLRRDNGIFRQRQRRWKGKR